MSAKRSPDRQKALPLANQKQSIVIFIITFALIVLLNTMLVGLDSIAQAQAPTSEPTSEPTAAPTSEPTSEPTAWPTFMPYYDLAISKVTAGSFTVGMNGTFTITVFNFGAYVPPGATITVTDVLPAGMTYVAAVSSSFTCSFVAPTVTCTRNTGMLYAENATISLVVNLTTAGVLVNTATVSLLSPLVDMNPTNNSSSSAIAVNPAPPTAAPPPTAVPPTAAPPIPVPPPAPVTQPVPPPQTQPGAQTGQQAGQQVAQSSAPILTVPTGALEGRVVAFRLRVRQGPGLNFPVLGLLARNTPVSIVGRNARGTWYQIEIEGGTAWVSARWVRVSRDVRNRVPVVTPQSAVPTP